MLTDRAESEIKALSGRFGAPTRWTREYLVSPDARNWANKLRNRPGEIVLVVPGRTGHVWLHTKGNYPPSVYRLPSGGIKARESIEAAALREAHEEMGFKPDIKRFLGIVENTFYVDGEQVNYPSYIFLTNSLLGSPQVTDPSEEIAGFAEASIEGLSIIAEQLDALGPDWQPWGHYRAAPHTLARQVLGE